MRYTFAVSFLTLAGFAPFAVAQNEGQGAPQIIQHKINPYDTGSVTAGTIGVVTPPIVYSGGALLPSPNIYFIWYGNWNQSNGSDTSAGQQIVRDFANSIGGSGYFQINTTYTVPGYTISGNVNFVKETSDAYSFGTRLRDSNILSIVNNAISSGKLPYDTQGVYFVLTSSDVNETSGFCTKYCGWHTAATPSAGHVRYSFVGNANRCLSSCAAQTVGPNGNAGVDGMISVIAHELEETTTDADPRSGWADSGGSENADKCAWTFGQTQSTAPNGATYNVALGSPLAATRNYLIQRNLKHATSGDTCNMTLSTQ